MSSLFWSDQGEQNLIASLTFYPLNSKKFKVKGVDGDIVMKEVEPEPQTPVGEQYCTNCWTTTGSIVMASIRGQEKSMICSRCLEHWLRYAVNRHVSDSTRRSNRDDAMAEGQTGTKKERKPKAVKEEEQRNRTPCSICMTLQSHNNAQVLSCAQCSVRVHEECYGVDVAEDETIWYCERCKFSRENPSAPLGPCVLCRNNFDNKQPVEAFKRTIGGGWVHVLCAIWIPEVKFADAPNLDFVDIATVDRKRWTAVSVETNRTRRDSLLTSSLHLTCSELRTLYPGPRSMSGLPLQRVQQDLPHCLCETGQLAARV